MWLSSSIDFEDDIVLMQRVAFQKLHCATCALWIYVCTLHEEKSGRGGFPNMKLGFVNFQTFGSRLCR